MKNPNVEIMENTQAGTEGFDKSMCRPRLNTNTEAKMFNYTCVPQGGAVQGGEGNLPRREGMQSVGLGVRCRFATGSLRRTNSVTSGKWPRASVAQFPHL